MKVPVLLYHDVGPKTKTNQHLTISPEEFQRQMRWLARHGYTAIRPSDFFKWHRHGGRLPAKPVLLTFDDALARLCEHALPVLEHHRFSAAVFVVTKYVGRTEVWDAATGWPGSACMTAEQIREWTKRGIEFGAHTRTHPDLTQMHPESLAREIGGSREDLARITGEAVLCFAYPYGYSDQSVREEARRNFELSFTCEEGVNSRQTDPAALLRTMIFPNDTWIDFQLRIATGSSPIAKLRGHVGLRTRLRRAVRFFRER